MRRSYFRLLEGLLFSLPLLFASCGNGDNALEEIINGGGSGGGGSAADHSNQYLVYSYSTALDSTWTDIPANATKWTGTVTPGNVAEGTYVVEGTAICAGQLVLMGEVNLIFKDGAKLTVNDGITYDMVGGAGSLNIYGQGISSSMGQLIVNNDTPVDLGGGLYEASGILVLALSVHGCKIETTGDTGGTATVASKGIEIPNGSGDITIYNGNIKAIGLSALAAGSGIVYDGTGNVNIYGGVLEAKGGNAIDDANVGEGFYCGGNLTIKGDAIVKVYGGADSGHAQGGHGIRLNTGDIEISGNADVYAESGKDAVAAIYTNIGNINISGGKVEAVGNNNGNGIEISVGTTTVSGGAVIATGGASGFGMDCKIVVGTGLKFYEDDSANPSASVAGTPGDGTTIIYCNNKRYVEIK
jgi:hypothetical protein